MTQTTERDALIASLIAVQDSPGVYFADGRYVDWSSRTGSVYHVEIGDGDGEAVQMDASRDDLLRIHAALGAHLLAHPE